MVTVFLSRVNKRIWYDLKHVHEVSHEMHVIFTSHILQMIHKTKIALVVFKSRFFNKALVKNIFLDVLDFEGVFTILEIRLIANGNVEQTVISSSG